MHRNITSWLATIKGQSRLSNVPSLSMSSMKAEAPPKFTLPLDILVQVLQLVPQQQRLTCCALVSHAWHTAAVAASSSIDIHVTGTTSDSQYGWLKRYGPMLRSVKALSWPAKRLTGHLLGTMGRQPVLGLSLPFKHLAALQSLNVMAIDMLTSKNLGTACGSIGDLTALTALILFDIETLTPETVGCISRLVNLRYLELDLSGKQYLANSLHQLTQLSRLDLYFDRQEPSASADLPVPSLTNLQQLSELSLYGDLECSALAELPSAVTCLTIWGWGTGGRWRMAQLPRGPFTFQSASLQQLELGQVVFSPNALSRLVQLRHLTVAACKLEPPNFCIQEMLNALRCLTNLQLLDLNHTLYTSAPVAVEAVQYSAIVSSSHLTQLNITCCQMPVGAVRHIFLQNRQLPAMRVVKISTVTSDAASLCEVPHLGEDDLKCIVSCCPDLQQLQFVATEQQEQLQLTALQQLVSLTHLSLGGPALDIEGAEAALLQLTGLRELQLTRVKNMGPGELSTLANLTQLSMLDLCYCMGQPNPGNRQDALYNCKLVSKATPPDVHMQFIIYCNTQQQQG